jgi:UDP-glucose 4-epimerase
MRFDVKSVLVTGGAGYVGSWLVREVLRRTTARVTVLDNLRNGRRDFLPDDDRVVLRVADLTDAAAIGDAVGECEPDWVFHLAALHFIPYCNAHPTETMAVNVVGTQNVLEALRVRPPARLVIVSTAAVYAPQDGANGEDSDVGPTDIYGLSKLINEQQLRLFSSQCPQTRSAAARLFNVFGPRETNPHVVPEIVRQALAGASGLDLGNVKPKRDYVYVGDVAAGLVAIASRLEQPYRVYNLGTGSEHSVEDIVRQLSTVSGQDLCIRVDPERVRASDRMHLLCDTARTRREVGWEARHTLASGMAELWAWERGEVTDAPVAAAARS